jgi:hypothetical protein
MAILKSSIQAKIYVNNKCGVVTLSQSICFPLLLALYALQPSFLLNTHKVTSFIVNRPSTVFQHESFVWPVCTFPIWIYVCSLLSILSWQLASLSDESTIKILHFVGSEKIRLHFNQLNQIKSLVTATSKLYHVKPVILAFNLISYPSLQLNSVLPYY